MYVKRKLVWFRNQVPIEFTNGISDARCNKTEDPVNNTCEITLYEFDEMYSSGTFLPEEGDLMYYYSKQVSSNSESELTDNDIIWTGKFVDKRRVISPDEDSLTLTIADWSYDVNNRYHSRSYIGLGMTTDQILIDVIQNKVEDESGNGTFKLDFDNVSTLRNDSTPFPVQDIAFSRPTHEWVQVLCGSNMVNTTEEMNTGRVIDDDMVFDIRGTSVYWYEAPDTPILSITRDTTIHNLDYSTRNTEKSNFLLLECGEDFSGNVIYHYVVDKNSFSKIQKDEKKTPLNLAGRNEDYDNEYHELRKGYTIETNAEFIEQVKRLAEEYGQQEFRRMGREPLRVTLDRVNLNIGDFVRVQIPMVSNNDYRVKSITHFDNDQQCTTALDLEERFKRF